MVNFYVRMLQMPKSKFYNYYYFNIISKANRCAYRKCLIAILCAFFQQLFALSIIFFRRFSDFAVCQTC